MAEAAEPALTGAAADAAERLYGLPLEDFVRERDAAAKALRREDREAAAAVAGLRKPSAHAWAVNQVARSSPELRDELLAAGDALRAAQEAAIGGGGRDELRAATARERAAVDALVSAAREQRPSGRPLSAAAIDRLRTTLHAAAGDEDVRQALAAGRLTTDAEGGGAWPFAAADAAPAETKRPRRAERAPAPRRARREDRATTPKRADEADRRAEEERRRAEEERRRAEEERRRELQERLAEARHERSSRERELARAEREARRAEERLERALAEAQEARERADAARAELDGARTALDVARDNVARVEEQLD